MLRLKPVSRVPTFASRVVVARKSDVAFEQKRAPAGLAAEPSESTKSAAKQFLEALAPYKSLARQEQLAGCVALIDVRKMIAIYRQYRDDPTLSEAIPGSDVVHSILTTLRRRNVVLRPMFHYKRSKIVSSQDEELLAYLKEISADVLAGKTYLSNFAITYLMTAFATLSQHAEVTTLWRTINTNAASLPKNLDERIKDPKLVGAFIRFADPSTTSLDEIKKLYAETVSQSGGNIFLDDAMSRSFLAHKQWSQCIEIYAKMCDEYPMKQFHDTFSRLHNDILSQIKDLEIGSAFFTSALAPDTLLKLHPSAAAAYMEYVYRETGDINASLEIFRKSLACFEQPNNFWKPEQYQLLTKTVMTLIFQTYVEDTPEARQAIESLDLANKPTHVLNSLLSQATKSWPTSAYLLQLQKFLCPDGQLPNRSDSLRVLLNSCENIEIEQSQIEQWWRQLQSIEKKPSRFDMQALAKACNQPERVDFFKSELKLALGEGFSQLELIRNSLAALEYSGSVFQAL